MPPGLPLSAPSAPAAPSAAAPAPVPTAATPATAAAPAGSAATAALPAALHPAPTAAAFAAPHWCLTVLQTVGLVTLLPTRWLPPGLRRRPPWVASPWSARPCLG